MKHYWWCVNCIVNGQNYNMHVQATAWASARQAIEKHGANVNGVTGPFLTETDSKNSLSTCNNVVFAGLFCDNTSK